MDRKEYMGNQRKEEDGKVKEGKGGSLKKEDKINGRTKTDVDDKLNVIRLKGKACGKALDKMKK